MRAARDVLLLAWLLGFLPFTVAIPAGTPAVMLANVYRPGESDLADYWVSEKYDGVRAYWDGAKLLTRSGNLIHPPQWFTAGWPRIALDGELWVGRGKFEATSATVRDANPDDAAWRKVRFMVFDLPAQPDVFTQRIATLQAVLSTLALPWVVPVVQFKVADQAALDRELRKIVAAGGEGLMLHRGSSAYRAERTGDLLKLKPYLDAEVRVIGYLRGNGKYRDMMGALQVERPDGLQFRLGTGFTDEQRRHPPPIGSWVTYGYRSLTAKGIPCFARFLRVRDDMPP
ncbi:MAG TPA: DNA ligase [Steroidobacteraceae bacterium]|jgi:DNA ligase-1